MPHQIRFAQLPSYPEARVAELLRASGLAAFIPCALPMALYGGTPGDCLVGRQRLAALAVVVPVLRFDGGFLRLFQGNGKCSGGRLHYISVEVHDFRLFGDATGAPVVDRSTITWFETLLRGKSRRFTHDWPSLAFAGAPGCGVTSIEVSALNAAPDATPLIHFLAGYFGSAQVLADLDYLFSVPGARLPDRKVAVLTAVS